MRQRGSQSRQLADEDYEHMASSFRLLANKHALKLIEAIGKGEWKVTELATRVGIKQPLASRRLIALDQGGLVKRRQAGRNVYYKIRDDEVLGLCKLMRKRISSREAQLVHP